MCPRPAGHDAGFRGRHTPGPHLALKVPFVTEPPSKTRSRSAADATVRLKEAAAGKLAPLVPQRHQPPQVHRDVVGLADI